MTGLCQSGLCPVSDLETIPQLCQLGQNSSSSTLGIRAIFCMCVIGPKKFIQMIYIYIKSDTNFQRSRSPRKSFFVFAALKTLQSSSKTGLLIDSSNMKQTLIKSALE